MKTSLLVLLVGFSIPAFASFSYSCTKLGVLNHPQPLILDPESGEVHLGSRKMELNTAELKKGWFPAGRGGKVYRFGGGLNDSFLRIPDAAFMGVKGFRLNASFVQIATNPYNNRWTSSCSRIQ